MSIKNFPLQTGLHQLNVNVSFVAAATPSTIRDGKSSIVSTVVKTATGHYTITLSELLGNQVSGVACIESVDDTPTDITCQWRYIKASKQIKIYTLTGAVLTDPEASARINFRGTFWNRADVQEA